MSAIGTREAASGVAEADVGATARHPARLLPPQRCEATRLEKPSPCAQLSANWTLGDVGADATHSALLTLPLLRLAAALQEKKPLTNARGSKK